MIWIFEAKWIYFTESQLLNQNCWIPDELSVIITILNYSYWRKENILNEEGWRQANVSFKDLHPRKENSRFWRQSKPWKNTLLNSNSIIIKNNCFSTQKNWCYIICKLISLEKYLRSFETINVWEFA